MRDEEFPADGAVGEYEVPCVDELDSNGAYPGVEGEADRQRDRQRERQRDRETDRQREREREREREKERVQRASPVSPPSCKRSLALPE